MLEVLVEALEVLLYLLFRRAARCVVLLPERESERQSDSESESESERERARESARAARASERASERESDEERASERARRCGRARRRRRRFVACGQPAHACFLGEGGLVSAMPQVEHE